MTMSSTTVMPGFTIFYDTDEWMAGWDPTKLAPLSVTVGDQTVKVRQRSWTS